MEFINHTPQKKEIDSILLMRRLEYEISIFSPRTLPLFKHVTGAEICFVEHHGYVLKLDIDNDRNLEVMKYGHTPHLLSAVRRIQEDVQDVELMSRNR